MGPLSKDSASWLPETQSALRAIADALKGRVPSPELLDSLRPEYENAVPDHKVSLEWYPKGYMFPEGRDQPAWTAEYGLLIGGKSLIAGWLIAAQDFEKVLASVS